MRSPLSCLLALLVGLQPAAVWAMQGAPAETSPRQARPVTDPGAPDQALPSFESLGLSFARIKRELRTLPPSTARTPLKLEYYVEVQGVMPALPLFRPDELTTGPIPYGAPTHADMLDHVTPLAFKAPAIPVSSLAIMGIVKLVQWEAQRAREERLAKQRRAAIDAERERHRRLKESLVVGPPK